MLDGNGAALGARLYRRSVGFNVLGELPNGGGYKLVCSDGLLDFIDSSPSERFAWARICSRWSGRSNIWVLQR